MAESTGEKNPDQPKLTQSKPDQSKSDQSNPDQSGQGKSNLDQSRLDKPNPDQSSPNQSSPDKSGQDESSRDESDLDHAKIDKLVAVNRELAIYLEEQLDAVLALRQSVAAIERALVGSAAMKKRYEKCLQSVKDEGAGLPDMRATTRIRGVLSRLQRSGTL
jgi:hypothetical protein